MPTTVMPKGVEHLLFDATLSTTAFAALALEIVLPWLIVYQSPAWVWLEHPTRIALVATFLVFIVVPLREMWSGTRFSEEDAPPE